MILLAALNWHTLVFCLFALLACGFAVAVLASQNIVHSAFYLTLSLGATSGLFFLAGADFLGAMQLMIYVGGTLVLLIFGVMLTAHARFVSLKTNSGELILGAIVGLSLLGLLLRAGGSVESWSTPLPKDAVISTAEGSTSTPVGLALTGVRVDKLSQPNAILRKGMSGYLMPFIFISMHLLVVLIGAGYMARTKRIRSGRIASPVAEATSTPVRPPLPFLLRVGLYKGIVFNLLLAMIAVCLWFQAAPGAESGLPGKAAVWLAGLFAASPPWVLPTLGLLFLLNALLLGVVLNWQRWGLIGLTVVALGVLIVVMQGSVAQPAGFLLVAALSAAVIVTWAWVLAASRPTLWSQME